MRLIDADELKKKLKLWAFNNVTTTSPTFDFVTEFDIDECPTVCDIEQIRAEIEREADYQDAYVNADIAKGMYLALEIIDKHTKGDTDENRN